MTIRTFLTAFAATAVLATSAAYAKDVPLKDPVKEAEIRAVMVAKGFDVRSVGTIDGKFEIYGIKSGVAYEIFLDQSLAIIDFKAA